MPGSKPSRAILALLTGIAVTAFAGWFLFFWSQRSDPAIWHKDWLCFYSAGEAFIAGGARAAYSSQCIDGYFWLYPPYWLLPYAALSALLSPLTAYGVMVSGILLAFAASLVLLRKVDPGGVDSRTLTLFIVSSAAFFSTVVTGQHSALLLLALTAAFFFLDSGRPLAAGLSLGLLGIKPNWAAFFVVWLLAARRWRVLAGMVAVGSLMIAVTIPMGLPAWEAYFTNTPRWLSLLLTEGGTSTTYPAHKLITFESFSRSMVGGINETVAEGVWIGLVLVSATASLAVWVRRAGIASEMSAAILLAIGANLYVEFYDALVLALPAWIWWTRRKRYGRDAWYTIGAAAAAIWAWQWISILRVSDRTPALVGGFVAVWLLAESWSARHRRDPHPAAS